MDVDIDDEYAGGRAGRKSDVRVRCALPPRVDDAGDRGRVVEAVRSQRLLPAGHAREHRDAEVGVAQCAGRERRFLSDAPHRRDRPRRDRDVWGRTCPRRCDGRFPGIRGTCPIPGAGYLRFRRSAGIPKSLASSVAAALRCQPAAVSPRLKEAVRVSVVIPEAPWAGFVGGVRDPLGGRPCFDR
jgi:hypothetical protein